jgi:hypothetical protein
VTAFQLYSEEITPLTSLLSENASLPDNYLEIRYHPHSGLAPKIIDLTTPLNSSRPPQDFPEDPFAPFPSIEDFEFIEHQVLENHTATHQEKWKTVKIKGAQEPLSST